MPGPSARLAAVLLAMASLRLAAAETVLGAQYEVQALDNATPDWRETTASVAHAMGDSSVHAEWHEIERFGVGDSQWVAGGHSALTDGFGMTIDFNGSPDHDVLPEFGAAIDLDAQLGGGFVGHLGGRRSRYPQDTATSLVGALELYRGDWRAAYTLVNGRLESGDSGTAHVLQVDHYYGEGSRVGLVGAAGSEATRIDAATVIVTDVASAALTGRHWFGRSWGGSYVYSWTKQGDFYTRQGGALGLLFRF